MFKFLILFTYTICTFKAFAHDFTGEWHGAGKVYIEMGRTEDCDMQFTVTETQTELVFSNQQYTCKSHSYAPKDVVYQIKSNKLYLDGSKVGTLKNNRIRIGLMDLYGPIRIDYKLNDSGKLGVVHSLVNRQDEELVYSALLSLR